MKLVNNLDVNLNQLIKAIAEVCAGEPSTNLIDGRFIYDSTTNQFKAYHHGKWVAIIEINDSASATSSTYSSNKIDSLISAINSAITGGLINKGGYDASRDDPSLDDGTPITGIKNGWAYIVTDAGNFFTEPVQVGDMIIAKKDSPTTLAHWTVVNKNIPDIVNASTSARGIIQLATAPDVYGGTDTEKAITPAALKGGLRSLPFVADSFIALTYKEDIGNEAATYFVITHALAEHVQVSVIDNISGEYVFPTITRISSTEIRIDFSVAPSNNQYKVVITG